MGKFKPGDRVVVVRKLDFDTEIGISGMFKRYNENLKSRCVIERDDGCGWNDHNHGGRGWSVTVDSLELFTDYTDYEMDA